MCEWVDTCPTTGLPIEQAPCHMIKNLNVWEEVARVWEQTSKSFFSILQAPGWNGDIATSFFRTWWTWNR